MRKRNSFLTEGERNSLILVGRGLSNQEIAEELDVPISKVKMYLYQSCNKLKANNRIDAVILALKQKAIKIHEIYSFEELVDLVVSIEPDMIDKLAEMLRERWDRERASTINNQVVHVS